MKKKRVNAESKKILKKIRTKKKKPNAKKIFVKRTAKRAIRRTITKKIITTMTEFTCTKYHYPAYKMSKLSHCPLCIICTRCKHEVRKCKCIEGE